MAPDSAVPRLCAFGGRVPRLPRFCRREGGPSSGAESLPMIPSLGASVLPFDAAGTFPGKTPEPVNDAGGGEDGQRRGDAV